MSTDTVSPLDPSCGLDVDRPFGAHMSIAGGPRKAVDRALRVSASALQIFAKNQLQWQAKALTAEQARGFRDAYGSARLRFLCSHASYLINLASATAVTRERSLPAIVDELERAEALGCSCVVMHPGSPGGDGRQVGVERVAAGLREALRRTDGMRVKLALENTSGAGHMLGGLFPELGDIIRRCDAHPRLAVCLDTCHAFAAGYGLRDADAVEGMVREIDESVGLKRLLAMHLNDSKQPCGSRRDRHEHIGEGQIGATGFRNILQHPLLRRVPGILETPKDEKTLAEDARNLKVLRRLDARP